MAGGLGGLGTGNKLFLVVDLDVTGDEQLDMLTKKIDRAGTGINRADNQLDGFNKTQENTADKTQQTSGQFGKMFGVGMNLMFLGMAMQKVFGGLAGSMLKLVGVSQTFGAAAKSVLLPFFIDLAPLLNKVAFWFMRLPKTIKWAIGAFVALLAVIGTVLFFGAQLALLAISLQISFAALAGILGFLLLTVSGIILAISFLIYIFKRFGAVVTAAIAIASVITAFFGSILAATLTVMAAFLAVNAIFKKFGKLIGTIATLVIIALAALLAPFISLPLAIGIALGAVIAWFWNMRDEIGGAIDGIIKWVAGLPEALMDWLGKAGDAIGGWVNKAVGFFSDLAKDGKSFIQDLIDLIISLPSKIKNGLKDLGTAMMGIGKTLINGVINGIKAIGGSLSDVFFDQLPDILGKAVKGISSFSGDLLGGITDVLTPNDFILTSGGKMIQPHKDDTLIGTKNPGQLGGGGGTVNVEINDPVMKEDVDVKQVVDEVEDRVNRSTRGRSGLGS